jgi:dolichol-phosphate mannosyltransferase
MPCEFSVVLPAYREAEALKKLLPVLVPAVNELSDSWEIIAADSMEPLDDTASVCAAHGVRHIHRNGGNPYGMLCARASGVRLEEEYC